MREGRGEGEMCMRCGAWSEYSCCARVRVHSVPVAIVVVRFVFGGALWTNC